MLLLELVLHLSSLCFISVTLSRAKDKIYTLLNLNKSLFKAYFSCADLKKPADIYLCILFIYICQLLIYIKKETDNLLCLCSSKTAASLTIADQL